MTYESDMFVRFSFVVENPFRKTFVSIRWFRILWKTWNLLLYKILITILAIIASLFQLVTFTTVESLKFSTLHAREEKKLIDIFSDIPKLSFIF